MKFHRIVLLLAFTIITIVQCKEPCDNVDCGPNGTCIFGECDCDPGWTGPNCAVRDQDSPKKYLKTVSGTAGIDNFKYDSSNRLIEVVDIDNSGTSRTFSYDFIQDTLFVELDGRLYEKYYAENTSTVNRIIYSLTGNVSYFEYVFGACGIESRARNGDLSYEYFWSGCNNYEVRFYNPDGTIFLEQDNFLESFPNPYPSVYAYFGQRFFDGVIKESKEFSVDGNGIKSQDFQWSYDSEFEFDSDGYIIKETRTFGDERTEERTFEYY